MCWGASEVSTCQSISHSAVIRTKHSALTGTIQHKSGMHIGCDSEHAALQQGEEACKTLTGVYFRTKPVA